ncbi:MAG: hypothetical protein PVS2B2_22070 [Candidatus Acidiferrum sp.]
MTQTATAKDTARWFRPVVSALRRALENTVCAVCGGKLERCSSGLFDTRFGVTGRYGTRRCVSCSFEQIDPVPNAPELKQLYESHYNFAGTVNSRYSRWREKFLFSFLNRCWMKLDGDIAFHGRRGSGRLLDVGCNEGRGLRLYARNGFNVEGLELNQIAAAEARKSGLTVHTCLLEEFYPETRFDVVVLSNVLEHSLNPREMLQEVKRILNIGGRVWISCPNSESWQRTVFGGNWVNWHVPFHISHFSTFTLRGLLGQTGFDAAECSQITPTLWMAQTWIVSLFAEEGKKCGQLRNPFLIAGFMLMARMLLFPVLWWGNRRGRGDCLVVVATAKKG